MAASAKIALSLMLTQTLTLILTLALTQTEEKHLSYFASRGKISTSLNLSTSQITKKKMGNKEKTVQSSVSAATLLKVNIDQYSKYFWCQLHL